MTGNGAADLEFRLDRDEGGDRLLLGVEAGAVKLAVVVPDDVSRATVEAAAAGCVRELVRHAGAGPEQASPGYDGAGGREHAGDDR